MRLAYLVTPLPSQSRSSPLTSPHRKLVDPVMVSKDLSFSFKIEGIFPCRCSDSMYWYPHLIISVARSLETNFPGNLVEV